MASDVPLLSVYKKSFVSKRLLQTFLGGPRICGVSCFAITVQSCLYVLPIAICVPVSSIPMKEYIAYVIVAASILTLSLLYQLIAIKADHDQKVDDHPENKHQNRSHRFSEGQDDFEDTRCHNCVFWSHFIYKKKRPLNIVVHSVLASLTAVAISYFLRRDQLLSHFPSNAKYYPVQVFSWLAMANALYGVMVWPPVEPATYRAHDSWEIAISSRLFHILILVLPDLVVEGITKWGNFGGVDRYWYGKEPWEQVSMASHLILPFMPLLWFVGILPPTDCFLLWIGEQIQVFALGGTVTYSAVRSAFQLTLSMAQLTVTLLIPNWTLRTVMIYSTVTGYLLSLNLSSVMSYLVSLLRKTVSANLPMILSNVALHLTLLGLSVLIVTMTQIPEDLKPCQMTSNRFFSDGVYISGWLLLIFEVTWLILIELRKVYIVFGLIRNPLYFFLIRSKSASIFDLMLMGLYNFIIPLWMCFYLNWVIVSDNSEKLPKWVETTAILRAMRRIWQSPQASLMECSILHLLESAAWNQEFACNVSVPIKLLLLGFALDRLKQVVNKIFFVITLCVSCARSRAIKRSYSRCLLYLDLLLTPIIITLILFSSVFSAPILAIFTLPIFFIACPRPQRFWPGPFQGHLAKGTDSLLYSQLAPSLAQSLQKLISTQRIGTGVCGTHYLARFEDKIIWIQILEQGNNYRIFGIRGLELQETSCHSLEATRLDDIITNAFESKSSIKGFALQHSASPITQVKIKMYSDTKSILTGVMDRKEFLERFARNQAIALTWKFLRYLNDQMNLHDPKDDQDDDDDQVSSQEENTIVRAIPPHSASIEAVRLDHWPSSNESTPNEADLALAFQHREDYPRVEPGTSPVMMRRRPILPPISSPKRDPGSLQKQDSFDSLTNNLESMFLPGGVMDKSPMPPRSQMSRQRAFSTEILSDPIIPACTSSIGKALLEHFPRLEAKKHTSFQSGFSKSWYERAVRAIWSAQDSAELLEDTDFLEHFQHFVESCLQIDSPILPNANTLARKFANLMEHEEALEKVHQLVILPSLRMSVKLTMDEIILASELDLEAIEELENEWYLGVEEEQEWVDAILDEKPKLFSVFMDQEGESKIRSRLLELKECNLSLFELNPEVVKALWASLSWELLYLTNDDDERFSIQADERILRNLTTQGADAPLGYSIFSSEPLFTSTHL